MKAAVISKPNEIGVSELEAPVITESNQVLIKVKRVGICGSDTHIFKGENPFASYPRIFGHEFTGEVAGVGDAVTKVKTGDHVVGEPIVSCGKCYACTHGRPNVCEKLGVMGVHIEGGCREYIVMEEEKVHKISNDVSWDVAVLTEPMTIGFQSTARGDVQECDVVLIMGAGTIGLCNLLVAKSKGAVCVITDIVDSKLEYAKKMGADYTINVAQEDLEKRMTEITNGMGPNVVLDCVCNKKSLEQAIEMVSVAGRVVELGFGPVASEVKHVDLMKKEVTLAGTRLQVNKFPSAVKLVEDNAELLKDFVTQKYALADVKEAFQYAIEHPQDVRKIVVEF